MINRLTTNDSTDGGLYEYDGRNGEGIDLSTIKPKKTLDEQKRGNVNMVRVQKNKKIEQLSKVYMSQVTKKYEYKTLGAEPESFVIDDDLQYNLKCIPLMEKNLTLSRYK
jgi:hypothetical protein